MGKGDKKSRRGKIILGTYGVRRHKKKAAKTSVKHVPVAVDKEIKENKTPRGKKEMIAAEETADIRESKELNPVKDSKTSKSAQETKRPKREKEKPVGKGTVDAALTGDMKSVRSKKESKDTKSEKTGSEE